MQRVCSLLDVALQFHAKTFFHAASIADVLIGSYHESHLAALVRIHGNVGHYGKSAAVFAHVNRLVHVVAVFSYDALMKGNIIATLWRQHGVAGLADEF